MIGSLSTRLSRLGAAFATATLVAGAIDLHGVDNLDATAHHLLVAETVAAPTTPCHPSAGAHFDAVELRIERPCATCIRTLQERTAPVATTHLATADPGAAQFLPVALTARTSGSARVEPARGPPLAG